MTCRFNEQLKRRRRRTAAGRHKRRYSLRLWSTGVMAILIVVFVFLFFLIYEVCRADLVEDAYGAPLYEVIPQEETQEVTVTPEDLNVAGEDPVTLQQEETIAPKEPAFVLLPVAMSEEDQRIVFDIATKNNISYCFVMAIIGHETEYTKDARSSTGDSGYMQINDCNLEDLADHGFVDMYDTADNVGGGCYILRKLFDTYGDDEVHKVLMAYNMGGGRAAELWAQGITTSAYSRDIVKREKELSRYIDEQNGLN